MNNLNDLYEFIDYCESEIEFWNEFIAEIDNDIQELQENE